MGFVDRLETARKNVKDISTAAKRLQQQGLQQLKTPKHSSEGGVKQMSPSLPRGPGFASLEHPLHAAQVPALKHQNSPRMRPAVSLITQVPGPAEVPLVHHGRN